MKRDKEKLRNQLMRYTKEEIINAILDQPGYAGIADNCLGRLYEIKSAALIEAVKKAVEREKVVVDKLCKWKESLKVKYGAEVRISDLSEADIKKTREITEEYEKAIKARDKAFNDCDRFSGVK